MPVVTGRMLDRSGVGNGHDTNEGHGMGDLILLGAAITLEPLPIIAFILVLSTDGGTRNGLAFIGAWLACLIGVIAATLAFTGGKPPASSSAPATAVTVALLVLGIGFLVVAFRRYRRPAPTETKPPAWMKRIDGMRLSGAAVLGVLMQPWPLVAAGAGIVTEADLSNAWSFVALVGFCLIATSSLATMEIYSIAAPEAAADRLAALHSWIDRHRAQAITVLSAVLGLYLISKSLIGLITTK